MIGSASALIEDGEEKLLEANIDNKPKLLSYTVIDSRGHHKNLLKFIIARWSWFITKTVKLINKKKFRL